MLFCKGVCIVEELTEEMEEPQPGSNAEVAPIVEAEEPPLKRPRVAPEIPGSYSFFWYLYLGCLG